MPNKTENKRARLGPAPGAVKQLLGEGGDCQNILQPLVATKGIIFPYTPDVTFGGAANYSSWHFTHSNYQQYQYQNSSPSEIQVTGTFTAQTNEEARYMIATLAFLRSSTMIDFGNAAVNRDTAGTPPPVLRFSYLGQRMFNRVPVVVQNFSYILERDVDYVEVSFPGSTSENDSFDAAITGGFSSALRGGSFFAGAAAGAITNKLTNPGPTVNQDLRTWVPTQLTLTVMLGIQQNPKNVRDNFDLDAFKRGDLINKGFI